jgi:hypothetical protein
VSYPSDRFRESLREEFVLAVSGEYRNSIYKRFSYQATWFPNTTVRLGDIGIQDHGSFKQVTALENIGVPFRIRRGSDKLDFAYTSESGVAIKPRLSAVAGAGTMLPQADAGISMTFSKEGAFLFQATGCTVTEIEDKAVLKRFVMKLFREGEWEKDWAVVDTIVRADSATIVISNSGSGSLDLTAKMPVALSGLAKIDAGFSVAAQSGDVIHFIAAQGLTPMFKLSRIKQSLLAGLMSSRSAITFGGPSSDLASSVSADDLLEEVAPEQDDDVSG